MFWDVDDWGKGCSFLSLFFMSSTLLFFFPFSFLLLFCFLLFTLPFFLLGITKEVGSLH
jgi:hypothetical protein